MEAGRGSADDGENPGEATSRVKFASAINAQPFFPQSLAATFFERREDSDFRISRPDRPGGLRRQSRLGAEASEFAANFMDPEPS
ncbi:hypothetical protein ABTF58_19555, partial [Acinetobacter baumannii]